MNFARTASLLAVGICLSAPVCVAQSVSDGKKDVVAQVSGQNLTMADLQQKEGGKLLQAEYQYYLNRRKALEELIDNQLLEDAARRKNISLEQLLNTEIYKDIKDPTEDQLEVYYEGMDSKESYASIRDEVLKHIRELRRTKARAAYVESLRKEAKINIRLMPPSAEVSTDGAYSTGPKDAPVTLLEFADYECPYCQKVHPQVEQLKKEYGDKLTIIYKDFPLPMHHSSEKAAEAARCAGEQNQFWVYHNILYGSRLLDVTELKAHARVLKLDGDRFDECLDSGRETAAVMKDLEEAKSLGLTGTPSFFVNGHFFSGVVDYAVIRDMVNQQLNVLAQSPPAQKLAHK